MELHLGSVAQQYYPPRYIDALVQNFLTQWAVNRDVEGLLRYIDTRQLRDGLTRQRPTNS
jgi:hypothetical protein